MDCFGSAGGGGVRGCQHSGRSAADGDSCDRSVGDCDNFAPGSHGFTDAFANGHSADGAGQSAFRRG